MIPATRQQGVILMWDLNMLHLWSGIWIKVLLSTVAMPTYMLYICTNSVPQMSVGLCD